MTLREAGEANVLKFGCASPVPVGEVVFMPPPQLSIKNDSVPATSTGLRERISNLHRTTASEASARYLRIASRQREFLCPPPALLPLVYNSPAKTPGTAIRDQ
jgi:hypothetical protein